jgi:23S rRNA (pseudouridine1915-N3)-methyltransferase
MEAEGELILAKLGADEQVVLLDERGKQLSSRSLASSLSEWQTDGRDLCFIIGGPDGVSKPVRQRADWMWALSELTLPHGMARALLSEQLYRAWSLQTGHPYHRS